MKTGACAFCQQSFLCKQDERILVKVVQFQQSIPKIMNFKLKLELMQNL